LPGPLLQGVPVLRRIDGFALTVEAWDWPFARARRADILAHFEAQRIAKPALFNGRILMMREPRHDAGIFHARCFEVEYASMIAWRDWGWPDRTVFNGFGMGALRGSDGVFVLGEMAAHTANAGRVYFAAGTPDCSDVRDGELDLAGSVIRELGEETGLAPGVDFHVTLTWHSVQSGQLIAFMQQLDGLAPAADLRSRIRRAIAAQAEPELVDIHLVRDRRDMSAAMPDFISAYIEAMSG